MGYNREDYVRIRAEYEKKYKKAEIEAGRRQEELHAAIPEVKTIDVMLARTGRDIMAIVMSGKKDVGEKVDEVHARNDKLAARRAELLLANGYPVDYSDIKYECEKCADSGFIDTVMCSCMKKALVLAGYESSGLGGLIRTQSFDNFSLDYYKGGGADYGTMQRVYTVMRSFAEGFDKTTYRNFLLFGGTGLGKTHLSTSVAKVVIERGFNVLYVTAVGMMNDFEKRQFRGADEREVNIDRYYSSDLLIIDDLGTEMTNQFTVSCLYDVINSRINNRKCTIINTNYARKEIETKYNERITSRLFGEYSLVPFSGTDVRRQKISVK